MPKATKMDEKQENDLKTLND
uniref:Uncharacterized protein n=1 Tax=Tetranychus urticae TaxID=32264 RepID=T1KA81_TETUR